MADLVSYINELVDNQIQMRSCIQLTPELQNFYVELMGRDIESDTMRNVIDDDNQRYEKSVEDFLMTKRKFKRSTVSIMFYLNFYPPKELKLIAINIFPFVSLLACSSITSARA